MFICAICRTEMICLRNGVGADFSRGHVYPGDLYKCGLCGFELLATVRSPIFDKEYTIQDYYIRVKDGGAAPVGERKRLRVLQRITKDFKTFAKKDFPKI